MDNKHDATPEDRFLAPISCSMPPPRTGARLRAGGRP